MQMRVSDGHGLDDSFGAIVVGRCGVIEAAENSELRKGRMRLPSLLVPSAKSTTLSP